MKVPKISLRREDFSEVDGAWMDRLLRPLNTLFSALYSAMSNGLTFADNVAGFAKDVTVSGSFPVKFHNDLPGQRRPVAIVIVAAVDITGNTSTPVSTGNPAWSVSGDQIVVSDVTGLVAGLTAGKVYRLTMRVE